MDSTRLHVYTRSSLTDILARILARKSARVGEVGGQVGEDRRARGKLNGEVAGDADILATILVRKSARMSVSCRYPCRSHGIPWNSPVSRGPWFIATDVTPPPAAAPAAAAKRRCTSKLHWFDLLRICCTTCCGGPQNRTDGVGSYAWPTARFVRGWLDGCHRVGVGVTKFFPRTPFCQASLSLNSTGAVCSWHPRSRCHEDVANVSRGNRACWMCRTKMLRGNCSHGI